MGTVPQSVSQPRTKRHYRTVDERRRIVEETLLPGTSVAIVARAHGVNANQVFAWRKMYQAGRLGSTAQASVGEASSSCMRLLPVTVSADDEREPEQFPLPVSHRRMHFTNLLSCLAGFDRAHVGESADSHHWPC